MKKLSLFALFLLSAILVKAQQQQPVEMADEMRSSGKIYVVIVTIVIIFIGLAIYLFSMDRRIKKIEKEN